MATPTAKAPTPSEAAKALFLNRVRSLFNIDAYALPELGEAQWPTFRDDPVRYLIGADEGQTAAIWREVEKRQAGQGAAAGALLTADQVMIEIEAVASAPVKKALRLVYDGKGLDPAREKGKIADVALRDLALEPVTLYRRQVPRNEAPLFTRRAAIAPLPEIEGAA